MEGLNLTCHLTSIDEIMYTPEIYAAYDLIRKVVPEHSEVNLDLAQEIARYAQGKPALTIIDLGCGTGYTSQMILTHAPKARCIGIDIEDSVVRQARKRLAEFKSQFDGMCGDVGEFLKSVESESVDVIASTLCLHNLKRNKSIEILEKIHPCAIQGTGMIIVQYLCISP